MYGGALSDAKKAIELKPSYIKGYYRRAASYLALGKYKLAFKDYEYVNNYFILQIGVAKLFTSITKFNL